MAAVHDENDQLRTKMMNNTAETPRSSQSQVSEIWWGDFSLDIDRAGRWRVGPTTLWIERHELEWRITHWQHGDAMDASAETDVPADVVKTHIPDDIEAAIGRYSIDATISSLRIRPALADRPVIVRPEEPLYVLSDETVTVFVSTPLWIQVLVGDGDRLLTEIPSFRPSDSWFGSNTREGELCYATATLGRMRLQDIPKRLHRAITPVVVHNRSGESLNLDRMRVPVEYLSLFQDEDGYLWTESIRFDKATRDELAALHLGKNAPRYAASAERITKPREKHDRSVLIKTFTSIINRITDA